MTKILNEIHQFFLSTPLTNLHNIVLAVNAKAKCSAIAKAKLATNGSAMFKT